LSHCCHCGCNAHSVAALLENSLKKVEIETLTDHFEVAEDIAIRIQTEAFDSFVFLFCPESWAASWCQQELAVARSRLVPILTARLNGKLPEEMKSRICVDLCDLTPVGAAERIADLAEKVAKRAKLYNTITALSPSNTPAKTRAAAESLFTDFAPTLLAESLLHISKFCGGEADPITRQRLALAIARAGTMEAKELLSRLDWSDHPLPQRGILQALELLEILNPQKSK
jgi:hypothetical protein